MVRPSSDRSAAPHVALNEQVKSLKIETPEYRVLDDGRLSFQGPVRLVYFDESNIRARETYVSDIESAYRACVQASQKGNGDAAAAIGHMYMNRSIVCSDYQTAAMEWACKSIESKSAYGHWVKGWILMERNQANEGIAELLQAMRAGFAPAAHDLGVIFQSGWGVPSDQIRSKEFFTNALKLGHYSAPWSIRNIEVTGKFGLLQAILSWLLRPFSKIRWHWRVFFGPKFTPLTLTYPFAERMYQYKRKSIV